MREHTPTTSLDTWDAITPTPLSSKVQPAFTWRKTDGRTIISALQDLARRAKNDEKAGTKFCFIPSASIALPVAIAHKNFLEYFTFLAATAAKHSTGLSACILGTTSLSSFFWVLIGDRSIGGIRRERRLEPEFDSSLSSLGIFGFSHSD
jgi:hypothetical protein